MTEEEMVAHLTKTGKYDIIDLPKDDVGNLSKFVLPLGRGRFLPASTPKGTKPGGLLDKDLNDSKMIYGYTVPKLPVFSGEEPVQKGEVSFKEWHFEVKCLQNDDAISSNSLMQSIRRSLRGSARQVLISLGEDASLIQILHKMGSMFACMADKNTVMQEFFNAHQRPDESVTAFACRLESILTNANDGGSITADAKNDMLRCKFWTSLHSDKLKSQTRHKYDSVTSYDKLIREVRAVEHELLLTKSTSNSSVKKTISAINTNFELGNKIKTLENNIDQRLTKLEGKLEQFLQLQSRNGFSGNQNTDRGKGRGWTQGSNNNYPQNNKLGYNNINNPKV